MGVLSEIETEVKGNPSVARTRRRGNDLRIYMNEGSVPEWEVTVKDDGVHAIERNEDGRVGGVVFEDGDPVDVAVHILRL